MMGCPVSCSLETISSECAGPARGLRHTGAGQGSAALATKQLVASGLHSSDALPSDVFRNG